MKNNSGSGISDYVNIVNQPGFLDSAAAGFARQADRTPGFNKAQRRESGFLTGFAGGLQGAANQQRASKLEEIEGLANQVAMVQGNLALQQGAGELMKTQAINFTASRKPEIFALAGALKSGNVDDIDQLFRLISTDAANELPGFKEKYGTYDHAVGGKIYFTKNGDTRGYGQKELFSQLPLEEVFGENAVELEPLLNNFQKYESKAMLEKLELDKLRSDIANRSAQTGLYNAQTKGVEAEIKAAEQPKSKYTEKSLEKIREDNATYAQETKKQTQIDEKFADAYDEIASQIESAPEKAGTDLKAQFNRIRSKVMSNNYAEAKAELARAPLFSGLKENFGSQVTDTDLKLFFSTIPSFDQNPTASIETARQRSKELREGLARKKATLKALDETNYYEPGYSQSIEARVNELLGQENTATPSSGTDNNSNLTKEEIAQRLNFKKAN